MHRSIPFCFVMLLAVSCQQPQPTATLPKSRLDERLGLMQTFPQLSPEEALRTYPDGGEIIRHSEAEALKLALYQTNKAPLATLQLFLPEGPSGRWITGRWRGELSSTYMHPPEHGMFASDLLKAPSWRPLEYRIDPEDFKFVIIVLQPDEPMDNIRLSIPVQTRSSLESAWWHWTDAGGAEYGTVRILER